MQIATVRSQDRRFRTGQERDIETAEFLVADELDITAQLVVSVDSGRAFTLFASSTQINSRGNVTVGGYRGSAEE